MKKIRAVPLILTVLIAVLLGGAYLIVRSSPPQPESQTAVGMLH